MRLTYEVRRRLAIKSLTHFYYEFWRVRWLAIFAVAVFVARASGQLPDDSATTLVLYKPAIACVGAIAAHIFWSQCFYYVDCVQLMRERRDVLLIAVFIARGLIYAAFILGVCLGL